MTSRRFNAGLGVGAVALGVALLLVSPAVAADGGGEGDRASVTITTPTDSQGISADSYTLSLDDGSWWDPTDPRHVWAPLVQMVWSCYRILVSNQIMVLRLMLVSKWTTMLVGPFKSMASGVESIINSIGLGALVVTILGVTIAWLFLRGRSGRALSELAVGCMVMALGMGILAHPTASVTKDGGAINQAQSAGRDIANEIFPKSGTDALSAQLVDTLIRMPHQYVNYGKAIDGTECEKTYNENIGKPDAWKAIGGCDKGMKAHAQSMSADKFAFAAVVLGPAGNGFMIFSSFVVLVFSLVVLAAAWHALRLTWTSITGVVSGSGRASFIDAFAGLGVSLGAIALAQTAVIVWMMVVQLAFVTDLDIPASARFAVAGLILNLGPLVMIVLWWKSRKKAKEAAERLARAAGSEAGSRPLNIGQAARTALRTASDLAMLGHGRVTAGLAKKVPGQKVKKNPEIDSKADSGAPEAGASAGVSPDSAEGHLTERAETSEETNRYSGIRTRTKARLAMAAGTLALSGGMFLAGSRGGANLLASSAARQASSVALSSAVAGITSTKERSTGDAKSESKSAKPPKPAGVDVTMSMGPKARVELLRAQVETEKKQPVAGTAGSAIVPKKKAARRGGQQVRGRTGVLVGLLASHGGGPRKKARPKPQAEHAPMRSA